MLANYECNLDIYDFEHILDDTTECYKFYWLDAILTIVESGESVISFNDIFDEMIADAWFSVAEHKLHLGPKSIDGEVKNSIERAVLDLKNNEDDLSFDNKAQVLRYIKDNQKLLVNAKKQLIKNVPYRLLSSFMPEVGGNDKIWWQTARLIDYISQLNESKTLPYIIENGTGYYKKIVVDKTWKEFFLDNMLVLKSWTREKKIEYLQKRNPNVPGIVYKLDSEKERVRKLKYVRKIWNELLLISPMSDIYSEHILTNADYEIDHFVPSDYIANDEMWNLLPMDSSLNSQKSNKLPLWDRYFPKFADGQYLLYYTVFVKGLLKDEFNNCYRDNILSEWAQNDLFIYGRSETEFKYILEKNLHPIYDNARSQGYKYWDVVLK